MATGTLKIVENFDMPQLKSNRTIRIYLPPEYENSDKRYPVLYMHDAQNLFDVSTSAFGAIWDAGTAVDNLYNSGKNDGIIIVGVDNYAVKRYLEYSPWCASDTILEKMPHAKATGYPGGRGFDYIDFIVHTLKPYIDENYRTLPDRQNTGIGGSSMGGFISIAGGIRYQNVFSKIASFSSASFFAEDELKELIMCTGKKYDMKIYMDVGTKETSNAAIEEFPEIYLKANKNIYETLRKVGFNDDEVKFSIADGAIHNEREWAKRFPSMLEWMY